MSQAVIMLSDVYVSKGYDNKPQTTFKANDGSDYGILHFKVSHKKIAKKDAKPEYDNYTIEWRNVKSDAKVIEFINQPGTRVSLYGELTQETYKETKFLKVTCDGRSSVQIATFGEKKDSVAPEAPASSNDDL